MVLDLRRRCRRVHRVARRGGQNAAGEDVDGPIEGRGEQHPLALGRGGVEEPPDDGTDLIRAREIAAVGPDYDGSVTVRLAGHDSMVVTLVAHRTHRDEHKPGDLHRQLLRVMAELGDSSAARVRPVHDESRGWEWVSEPPQRPAKRGISAPCGSQPAAGAHHKFCYGFRRVRRTMSTSSMAMMMITRAVRSIARSIR